MEETGDGSLSPFSTKRRLKNRLMSSTRERSNYGFDTNDLES